MSNKTLLSKDEKAIEAVYRKAETGADKLNAFIKKAEGVCKTKFTNEELEQLRANGGKFLMEWIRAQYKFPDADDKFNQQALGMDVSSLVALYAKESKYWISYNYKKDKSGHYVLDGEPVQTQRFYKYIETAKQAKALKLANEIADRLNEAVELGFIAQTPNFHKFYLLGDILTLNRQQTRIIPNKDRIGRII